MRKKRGKRKRGITAEREREGARQTHREGNKKRKRGKTPEREH